MDLKAFHQTAQQKKTCDLKALVSVAKKNCPNDSNIKASVACAGNKLIKGGFVIEQDQLASGKDDSTTLFSLADVSNKKIKKAICTIDFKSFGSKNCLSSLKQTQDCHVVLSSLGETYQVSRGQSRDEKGHCLSALIAVARKNCPDEEKLKVTMKCQGSNNIKGELGMRPSDGDLTSDNLRLRFTPVGH